MLTLVVIVNRQPVQPLLSLRTLSLFNHLSKFTYIHPFYIQSLANCPSSKPFLLLPMHFDGGVYPPLHSWPPRPPASPLESALPSQFRVLPSFGRSCPPPNSLESALTKIASATFVETALTKTGGRGYPGEPAPLHPYLLASILFP